MYDAIDTPDLQRETAHRADALQRTADRARLRAAGRPPRGRLPVALRRALAAVDGGRRAI
jgi:hypothetical protein